MAKVSVIDLLNEYLAKGQMPPKEILQQAAESEALQAPPAALDPVQLATGAYAFGPLSELANESIGAGMGYAVPKLLKMAPRPASGLAMPMSGRATSDLAGGATEPLLPKGIKLPGGQIVAKGTKAMPGAQDPWGPVMAQHPTSELGFDDAMDMAIDATGGGPIKDINHLINVLGGVVAKPPSPSSTSPLPPQGANTTPFGALNNEKVLPSSVPHFAGQWKPEAPKTEPLTPFEAWQNTHNPLLGGKETSDLTEAPGSIMQGTVAPNAVGFPNQMTTKSRETAPNQIDNRTASLESADIEEMAGRETPPTQDLLAALAQNLSPKDTRPLPENTIYHGLNVFGQKPPKDALARISEQGMKGGWFSEEPHAQFGPHFIATRPEDLPPLLIRSKQFNIDPEKEIIPRWKKMNTENLETAMRLRGKAPGLTLTPDEVKGRPAMRSNWPNIHQLVGADEGGGGFPLEKGGHVVPPEKLFLSNRAGDILGRMAPKGSKPNALNSIMDKARAFRNVLEKGTKQGANSIDSVFHKLWGDEPELKGASKATKINKLKIFVAQPEPENPALAKIWKPFMDAAKEALLTAGEDIPK